MPNHCIDQVNDTGDANDQCSTELQQQAGSELSNLSSADNTSIMNYYRNSTNSDSALHHLETSSDSLSNDSSNANVRKLISDRAAELRNGENDPTHQSDVEKAVDEGKARDANGNPLDDKTKEEINKTIQERLALELEAMLVLEGLSGDPIMAASDRLRETAGDDLPDDFDDQLENWIEYQKRQHIGNEEAESLGLKDDSGNPLRFPCADSDEDLAAALDAFTDAYEKNQRGELSGSAADGYKSKEDFNYDWRSSLEMCLDPISKDDQAQIGSCAMNTQLVAGWTKAPKEMANVYCDLMTQGYHVNDSGEEINIFADELGRGNTNGQEPCVFIGCSALSSAAYGDNARNGLHHRNGNVVEYMDDALEVLTNGYSVSSTDGAYHKLSPGHSMGALNMVRGDGSMVRYQYNHWNQMGANEPGEGVDYNYKHEVDLSELEVG